MPTQSYANHRRWNPLFHFVAMPMLYANFGYRVWAARDLGTWWDVVLSVALIALGFAARTMALMVQNRVIRLEERLRLARVLPAAMQAEVARLSTSQLVGLRFASDAELPALVQRCLAGELTKADDVKKQVQHWQPDTLRA
jgi:hypothetical protein